MTPRAAVVYDCLFPLATGGGERVYRRIAELLVERGWQVDYLTRDQWSPEAPPVLPFHPVPVWRGEIHDESGDRTVSSALAFARGVRSHLRRTRDCPYDLVIASALPVLTLLAARSAISARRTLLVADWLEVWGLRQWVSYSGPLTGAIAWALQSIAVRCARQHSVNSRFTAERLRRLGVRDPLVLGLVDLVDGAGTIEARHEPPYALFVGRHIADKHLESLPAGLAEARKAVPSIRAIVVGEGPTTGAARAASEAAGVREEIDFVGRVDDARLDRLYAGAAVLVSPSAREGFGLVVAEASSYGVPSVVVAGPDNAAADLVDAGVNGVLASDRSPAVLGAAIASAVEGGEELRASSLAWFRRQRKEAGLAASVDEILRRYASTE